MQGSWQKVIAILVVIGVVAISGAAVEQMLESNLGSISDVR